MAGISSCLLIDKAAYETQEFVLKAIRRDVINRVEISPSPFIPTAIADIKRMILQFSWFVGLTISLLFLFNDRNKKFQFPSAL